MENIASKIKALNFPDELKIVLDKFMICLSDSIVSLEEMVHILNYLGEKGISLRPSHIKIFANGFSYIHDVVEEMEALGELQAFVEDPNRINSKGAIKRLKWMMARGYEYKSEEGKYAKTVFSSRAFEGQYGLVDLDALTVTNADEQKTIEPELTPGDPLTPDVPLKEMTTPILEEKQDEKIVLELDANPLDLVADFGNNPVSAKEDEVNSVIDYTAAEVTDNFNNPYEEILSKPQTIALNDETFDRYEKLSESIRHILVSVYNISEVNDAITDRLIKLVTNGVDNDYDVVFYAITYGKSVDDIEAQRLKEAIAEELEYTSILDLDIAGVAK